MAGRAKESLPRRSLKYLFVYLRVRMLNLGTAGFSSGFPHEYVFLQCVSDIYIYIARLKNVSFARYLQSDSNSTDPRLNINNR